MKGERNAWTVDPSKTTDCLDILLGVLDRHPDFFRANLAFDRNMMELLHRSAECLAHLGPERVSVAIEPTCAWGIEYVESDDFGYDGDKIRSLRNEIVTKAKILELSSLEEIRGLEADLGTLKAEHPETFKKMARALIVTSPFLYNHRGAPKIEGSTLLGVRQRIEDAEVPALENLYLDLFTEFLCPLFVGFSNQRGYGQVHDAARFVLNRFIETQVLPATRLYAKGSKELSRRRLLIREVPRPFGLFRGMIGKDCSMVSVPFYALSQQAHVYWIWKGGDEREQPSGYAFVLDCRSDRVPYAVTINGPTLNYTDAKAVLYQIAHAAGTDRLYVPSSEVLPTLVNTNAITKAMNSFRSTPVQVDLPEDWASLDDYSGRTGRFSTYYRTSNLKDPRCVQLESRDFIISQWEMESRTMYAKPLSYTEFSIFDRAVVGEYALSPQVETPEDILQILDLEEEHIRAVKDLRSAREHRYLSPDVFLQLAGTFGFTVAGLLEFDSIDMVMNSIRDLYDALDPSDTDGEWARIVQKINRVLLERVGEAATRDLRNDLISSKLSLPDVYIANYWQENSPHLYFEDGGVYHYRIHRFAKFFTSRATVQRFLDFLESQDEILEAVDPGAPSWQVFFEKAYAYRPDDSRLAKFLERVFLRQIRDEDPGSTDYSFAAALVSYCMIVGERGPEVFYEHLASQPRSRIDESFRQLIGSVRPQGRLRSYTTHPGFGDHTLQADQRETLARIDAETD